MLCYIFRHGLPVIWTFSVCLEAVRSLMNCSILLTFHSKICKEIWFNLLINAMKDMATENMKFKENNSPGLSMSSGLPLLLFLKIFCTLESAPLPTAPWVSCFHLVTQVETVRFKGLLFLLLLLHASWLPLNSILVELVCCYLPWKLFQKVTIFICVNYLGRDGWG